MAALFGFGLLSTLQAPQLHSWGWRVPFFFGLLVGPVGLYIRRKVDETPEFLATTHTRTPIREIFATEKMALILGAGLVAIGTAATYFSLYMPTYATTQLHLPPTTGYIVAIALAVMAIVILPLAGQLADRFGFVRLMLPAAVFMLFSIYPVFLLITRHPQPAHVACRAAVDRFSERGLRFRITGNHGEFVSSAHPGHRDVAEL